MSDPRHRLVQRRAGEIESQHRLAVFAFGFDRRVERVQKTDGGGVRLAKYDPLADS